MLGTSTCVGNAALTSVDGDNGRSIRLGIFHFVLDAQCVRRKKEEEILHSIQKPHTLIEKLTTFIAHKSTSTARAFFARCEKEKEKMEGTQQTPKLDTAECNTERPQRKSCRQQHIGTSQETLRVTTVVERTSHDRAATGVGLLRLRVKRLARHAKVVALLNKIVDLLSSL